MNADSAYSALGPCEEFESDLVEFVDGALDPAQRAKVQRHLDGCPRCRAFAQDFGTVHASLAQALPRVELSADFDARLQARISDLTRNPAREAARVQAEREYRGALESLRRGLTWGTALNAVAMAAVGGGIVTALGDVAPRLLHALHVAPLTNEVTSLGIGGLAVAISVLAMRMARSPSWFPFG
jgi:anti-sigma factor RsiW